MSNRYGCSTWNDFAKSVIETLGEAARLPGSGRIAG
jgi:hypothetical protein